MKETENRHRARLLAILAHIQSNLDNDLSLDALSSLAGLSPFHFHRVFQAATGVTLAAHVRRLRLARAAHELEFGRAAVTEVGLDAGYEALEAFTRAFKQGFGETPSVYRKKSRLRRREFAAKCFADPEQYLINREGVRAMEVNIVEKPALRVAYVRATGPYMHSAEEAWKKMCALGGAAGLLSPQAVFLGVSHDDPASVAPEHLRYDACIVVGPDFKAQGEIQVAELPAGEYAVAMHKGPYEKLFDAYMWLYGVWLQLSGRKPAAHPGYEIYVNSPENTAPEDLLTEINLPLAPL